MKSYVSFVLDLSTLVCHLLKQKMMVLLIRLLFRFVSIFFWSTLYMFNVLDYFFEVCGSNRTTSNNRRCGAAHFCITFFCFYLRRMYHTFFFLFFFNLWMCTINLHIGLIESDRWECESIDNRKIDRNDLHIRTSSMLVLCSILLDSNLDTYSQSILHCSPFFIQYFVAFLNLGNCHNLNQINHYNLMHMIIWMLIDRNDVIYYQQNNNQHQI